MSLGFWNRLALVLAVVGIFAFPTWWALGHNVRHGEVMNAGYETCIEAGKRRADREAWENCHEVWLVNEEGYIGWNAWGEAVLWAIPAAAIIYALARLIVIVAKWVGRGRKTRQ